MVARSVDDRDELRRPRDATPQPPRSSPATSTLPLSPRFTSSTSNRLALHHLHEPLQSSSLQSFAMLASPTLTLTDRLYSYHSARASSHSCSSPSIRSPPRSRRLCAFSVLESENESNRESDRAERQSQSPPPSPPPQPSSPPSQAHNAHHLFIAGLVSGVSVAGLFNPWDRALYLSMVHERPFLLAENFTHPYKGFYSAIFHRTLSSGMYFPLFDYFEPMWNRVVTTYSSSSSSVSDDVSRGSTTISTSPAQRIIVHFLAGNTAGAVSGAALNQLVAVKYASWENEHGFFRTALGMWRLGGLRPFMRGTLATIARDSAFGGTFAVTKEVVLQIIYRLEPMIAADGSDKAQAAQTRETFRRTGEFAASLVAGALGTIVSSPFNFARNIKYGWPASSTPPSSFVILKNLLDEARAKPRPILFLHERLRIGWGTLRVAFGMAVGYIIYDFTKRVLAPVRK